MVQSSDPQPVLTVITPVLNAADTLPATLDSVQRLPAGQVQHIVVDGGSTDGTLKVLENRSGVSVLKQHGRGISPALNQGLAAAAGRFVVVLNADDFFLPPITDVLTYLSTAPDDTIYFSDIVQHDPQTGHEVTRRASIEPIAAYMSLFHPGLFVPGRIYQQIGGYDTGYQFAMDCEWVHRSLARGVKFTHLSHVTSCMRLRGKSHLHVFDAMREFERSARGHGLIGPVRARWYRWRQALFHQLFKQPWFQTRWLRLSPGKDRGPGKDKGSGKDQGTGKDQAARKA